MIGRGDAMAGRSGDCALSRKIRAALAAVVVSVLALAWLPWAFWTGCLASAIRVAIQQGRWPSYGQLDPKSLPAVSGPIPAWVELALPLALWAGLTALAYAFVRRFVPPRWRIWAGLLLICASWGLCWALMMIDPGGVLEWYFD